MSTGTKAKRCYWCENSGGGITAVTNPVTVHDKKKGWLMLDDGAPIPLPADVRRGLKARRLMADIGGQMANVLFNCCQSPELFKERAAMIDGIRKKWDAIDDKHERAEKRRKEGGR